MTLESSFGRGPPKMSLTNLVSGDELKAQYNPEKFKEVFGAVWSSSAVPGFSSTNRQFVNTKDNVVDFTLLWSCANGGRAAHAILMAARRFLKASVHPRAVAGNIGSGGAPRILLVWPRLLSLTCTLDTAELEHTRFNLMGASVYYSAKITMTEIRDNLVTMEDVLRDGANARLPPRGFGGPKGGVV